MTNTIKSPLPHTEAARSLLNGASSCAVVFNAQHEVSRAFAKDLLHALKPYRMEVALAAIDKKKSELPPLDIAYTAVMNEDFNLFRQLKNRGKIADFLARKYDLLIDTSLSDTWKAEKLIRKIQSRFKIGINKTSDIFDFRFSLPNTPQNPAAFDGMLACLEKIDLPGL